MFTESSIYVRRNFNSLSFSPIIGKLPPTFNPLPSTPLKLPKLPLHLYYHGSFNRRAQTLPSPPICNLTLHLLPRSSIRFHSTSIQLRKLPSSFHSFYYIYLTSISTESSPIYVRRRFSPSWVHHCVEGDSFQRVSLCSVRVRTCTATVNTKKKCRGGGGGRTVI